MKKGLCLLLAAIMCVLAVGCGNINSSSATEETVNTTAEATVTTTEPTTEKPTEPPTTEPPQLSESCDLVLASGYDKDGNYYELVANETEDYDGTKIEIGAIKNNEWTVELTSDSPFIGEKGLLKFADKSIYDDFADFEYVGNGCFYYDDVIFNGNTGKYQEGYFAIRCQGLVCNKKSSATYFVSNEGKFIYAKIGWFGGDDSLYLLDTNTMQSKKVNYQYDGEFVYPYSDGLFACVEKSGSGYGFFNLDGEKVFDLSPYNTYYLYYNQSNIGDYDKILQSLVFEDGKCSFTVKNDQGTEFMITINTDGEVIDSYEFYQ